MPALSLLHPVLTVFLAATWAHDESRVRQKALYIRKRIEERLGQDSEQRWWLGWEHYLKHTRSQRGYRSLGNFAARGIFLTSSLVAIALGCTPLLIDGQIRQTVQDGLRVIGVAPLPAPWIIYLTAVGVAVMVTIAPLVLVLISGAKRKFPFPPDHDGAPTDVD